MKKDIKKSVIRRINEITSHSGMSVINSVDLWMGYVESARFSLLPFKHINGFLTLKETLFNLHDSIRQSLDLSAEYEEYVKRESCDEDYMGVDSDMKEFLLELQPSNNNDQPAGYSFYQHMENLGWYFGGAPLDSETNFGIKLTIVESAETVLSSKHLIENMCNKFEGIQQKNSNNGYEPGDLEVSFWINCIIPSKQNEK